MEILRSRERVSASRNLVGLVPAILRMNPAAAMRRSASVLAVVALCVVGSHAQDAAESQKCTITGTVVDATSGQPLRDSSVSAMPQMRSQRPAAENASAITDATGRFSFENLAPGRYMLSASHEGYISEEDLRSSDVRRQFVLLTPGQQPDDVVVRLIRGATISGQVVNSKNQVLPGVTLQALRRSYRLGRSVFNPVANSTSDKAGEYQLKPLPPGKYYLRAIPPRPPKKDPVAKSAYVPMYFPAMPSQDGSSALVLRPGEQMAGVDITLNALHTVTVSGRLLLSPFAASSTSSASDAVLGLEEEGGIAPWPYEPEVDAKGNFEVLGVPAGNYVFIAHRDAHSEKERELWGQRTVQVGEVALRDVEIGMSPGVEVGGHISVEGNADVDLSRLIAVLDAVPNSAASSFTPAVMNAPVSRDGNYGFHDVRPGSYRIYFFRPTGGSYYLKSVQSVDPLETGVTVTADQSLKNLDLVLSPGAARIDGTVEQNQQPSAGVQVVLIPDGARRAQPSYFRQAITDSRGRFALENIPPGDYKLFASQEIERGAYLDPAFLQRFEDWGKAVSLKEGASINLQLDAIPSE